MHHQKSNDYDPSITYYESSLEFEELRLLKRHARHLGIQLDTDTSELMANMSAARQDIEELRSLLQEMKQAAEKARSKTSTTSFNARWIVFNSPSFEFQSLFNRTFWIQLGSILFLGAGIAVTFYYYYAKNSNHQPSGSQSRTPATEFVAGTASNTSRSSRA